MDLFWILIGVAVAGTVSSVAGFCWFFIDLMKPGVTRTSGVILEKTDGRMARVRLAGSEREVSVALDAGAWKKYEVNGEVPIAYHKASGRVEIFRESVRLVGPVIMVVGLLAAVVAVAKLVITADASIGQ